MIVFETFEVSCIKDGIKLVWFVLQEIGITEYFIFQDGEHVVTVQAKNPNGNSYQEYEETVFTKTPNGVWTIEAGGGRESVTVSCISPQDELTKS